MANIFKQGKTVEQLNLPAGSTVEDGIASLPFANGAIVVTDGDTTVDPAATISFDGATVTDEGGGEALVTVSGGSNPVELVTFDYDFDTGVVAGVVTLEVGDRILAGRAVSTVLFAGGSADPDVYLYNATVDFPNAYNFLAYFHVYEVGSASIVESFTNDGEDPIVVNAVLGKDLDGTPPGCTSGAAQVTLAVLHLAP